MLIRRPVFFLCLIMPKVRKLIRLTFIPFQLLLQLRTFPFSYPALYLVHISGIYYLFKILSANRFFLFRCEYPNLSYPHRSCRTLFDTNRSFTSRLLQRLCYHFFHRSTFMFSQSPLMTRFLIQRSDGNRFCVFDNCFIFYLLIRGFT